MATTTITLALGGCVNGAPVNLSGRAELNFAAGRLELELASRATSLHWDPVLGLLGMLDVAKLLAVVGDVGLDTAFLRCRASLCDDPGRDLGLEILSRTLRGEGPERL